MAISFPSVTLSLLSQLLSHSFSMFIDYMAFRALSFRIMTVSLQVIFGQSCSSWLTSPFAAAQLITPNQMVRPSGLTSAWKLICAALSMPAPTNGASGCPLRNFGIIPVTIRPSVAHPLRRSMVILRVSWLSMCLLARIRKSLAGLPTVSGWTSFFKTTSTGPSNG